MSEGTIISVASILLRIPRLFLAASVVSVFLTESRLEDVWMKKHLLFGMSPRTSLPGSAIVFDSLCATEGIFNHTNVRAQLWGVVVAPRLSARPRWVVRKLALRPPPTNTIASKALAWFSPEDVEHLVITPKICWHRHGVLLTLELRVCLATKA
jgi:hypothetical protein